MAKKFNAAQFRSQLNQSINRYNQQVREYNRKVDQAINKYNQAVRQHNARVKANRQRLNSAIARLNSQASMRYSVTSSSSIRLYQSYQQLDNRYESGYLNDSYGDWIDLAEREAANSAELSNSLQAPAESSQFIGPVITSTISYELKGISEDLDNRWKGAIFSLNPHNPDAARHFCTSSREVIIQLIEMRAPDEEVRVNYPSVKFTENGKPSRRSKIEYLLHQNQREALADFTESNIEDIMILFRDFNNGTHGSAGRYSYDQLLKLKTRVEDSIKYLYNIAYN
ncbi:hypothetical protein DFQ04_0044 [Algoriphagus boseongensis]|uniref:Predicted pPIWI-associating nuclease domain-containing protein n=1 Tax=Algoriphagus boseongensis TaxID=1442587 RepID=A0A4R6T6M1_9BACT|nr:hypothetical protein [Algoriphagus boseongensis]TDQ18246.1 hypothetical protein DFQ04_0044 [Algoriphagus boseongensis]